MKKVHSMLTPSRTVLAHERLLEQQNQRIRHHPNEMSSDEIRLFEHTFLEEFYTKNPDLKPMGGINISWCKVLYGISIIHTHLSVGSIVPASIFHNAELNYIAIISHSRSAWALQRSRGRLVIIIYVFTTFILIPISYAGFGRTNLLCYNMLSSKSCLAHWAEDIVSLFLQSPVNFCNKTSDSIPRRGQSRSQQAKMDKKSLQNKPLQNFYVILNFLQKVQGCVTAAVVTKKGASKMQNNNKHNNVINNDGGGAGPKVKGNSRGTIFNNSNQHPSYNASTKAVLKSLPLRNKKARAISKKEIGQTQEEFRRQNEQRILSDIIKYESELGIKPEWFDLLCRFSRLELTAVEQELRWVYPHLFVPTNYKQTEMVIA